ncbi:uncharacterized protein LOC119387723 [Rhipicephalus sanguineus]|uniref:uncharacterized protein LOC119387723 n=1 Tax=Rhipicephalus sanguineus TaxID=34632 RepID=UPI00189556A5|nr:uncharacterized protein LOC119387723 [Rhipicephalus sanguineus]
MLLSSPYCFLLTSAAIVIMADNSTLRLNVGGRARQCCPDFNFTLPDWEEEERDEAPTPPVQQRTPHYTLRPAHVLSMRQSSMNYLLRPYQTPYAVVIRRPPVRPQRPLAFALSPPRTAADRNGSLPATTVGIAGSGGTITLPIYSRPMYGAPYYRPYYHHVYRGTALAPIHAGGFVVPYPAPSPAGLQPPAQVTVPVYINVGAGGIPPDYQQDGDAGNGFLPALGAAPQKATYPQTSPAVQRNASAYS